MEIASALPVKTPPRPDVQRAPQSQDRLYNDDFDAELTLATEAPRETAKPETQDAPALTSTEPLAKDETATGNPVATETTSPVAFFPALVPPAPVSAAPVPTPALLGVATPQNHASIESALIAPTVAATPNVEATEAQGAQTMAATMANAPTEHAVLQPSAPSKLSTARPDAAAAQTAAQTVMLDFPAAQAQPAAAQSQFVVPAAIDLAAPKPAAAAQKKPGASAGEVNQSPTATPAAVANATQGPAAAPVSQPQGQGGATKDSSDHPQVQGGAQNTAAAQGQTQTTQTQDFKPDAGAASGVQQTASPTVQNALPTAPALVAQNAPVFVPPEALGVVIARKALEGVNKFELRLDPPELGRLDVTLEVDEAGNTRAHIRAERPEALELLQREAKGMEQALRQAGLNLDASSLSFSLSNRDGRETQNNGQNGKRARFNAVLPENEIHAAAIRGNAPSANGVDMRV